MLRLYRSSPGYSSSFLNVFKLTKTCSLHLCRRSGSNIFISDLHNTVVHPFKPLKNDQSSIHSMIKEGKDSCAPKREFVGSCACGAVGFVASGPSSLNFFCHCKWCRLHSKQVFTSAAAFLPRQVRWINEQGMIRTKSEPSGKPGGPLSERLHCASCGSYVADAASGAMGVTKLSLVCAQEHAHKRGTSVNAIYLPNHHIFYNERVNDVEDGLPKWLSFPGDKCLVASATSAGFASDSSRIDRHTQYNVFNGRFQKDVLPLPPTRPPAPGCYWYTEQDPPINHVTTISQEKVEERRARKYITHAIDPKQVLGLTQKKYGAIVVGGGHNGLVCASYLAKNGVKDVLVLERRPLVGGAAVTEEMIEGFKFSRGSYLAGLLRPRIIKELELETKYGMKYLVRDPSSFTPSLLTSEHKGKFLLLGSNEEANYKSIAQFSERDAEMYPEYEAFLHKIREMMQPIIDNSPIHPFESNNTWKDSMRSSKFMTQMIKLGRKHKEVLIPFYELFTGPASQILDRWFESEMLKTTLATDAVIGANVSPRHNGSAYVLLHHVMGEAAGRPGVWAYVEGGMGAVSEAIASSARAHGAQIVCNAAVAKILHQTDGNSHQVTGVQLEDGTKIESDMVLSGATPYHTYLELLPGLDTSLTQEQNPLPSEFAKHIRFTDYSCQCFKINIATNALPNFDCFPTGADGKSGPQHRGTCHFENTMEELENAYRESSMGIPASRPVIELTIPSSLDNTISPTGKHVVQLFVQFAPYDVDPKVGHWADPGFKENFVHRCLAVVDEFCPNFTDSIIGYDALSPLDIERVFGMHKGSIHHGALALHQIGPARPVPGWANYRSPLKGLYLVGAGAHPGGGVMGAAGRNGAMVALADVGLAR